MRWLFVFALVLLTCTAAPVLARSGPKPADRGTYLRVNGSRIGVAAAQAVAASPSDAQAHDPEMGGAVIETEPKTDQEPEGASPSTPVQPVQPEPALEPIDGGPLNAPSPEEAQEVIEADERTQATKEEWLESEEAVRQRDESRHEFADVSATEAESLLPLFFSEQLATLNGDPARLLTNLDVVKSLGANAALIAEGKDEFSLLESSVPIESEVGQKSKQPLDLDLERSGDTFTAKNPLADISLPDSAIGAVRLESGVEIGLPAAADSEARPVEDVGLVYPESEKSTDTVVAPVTAGVEVFQQLRSPQSPEAIRFNLGLPPETRLVPTEGGGAAVVSASGESLVYIPPPWAVDAQGSAVPIAMTVQDRSVVVEVQHRSGDFAYPILVDPAYIEEGAPFGNWGAAATDQYSLWNSPVLGAQAKGSSYSYAANSFGHWVWTTHGATTYISQATFSPTTFTLPSNCGTEQPTNQPHGYAGLYNPSSGGYSGLGIWFGGSSSGGYGTLENAGGPGVRQAVVGIGAGPSTVKHKCAFTFEVGGVTVRQKDPEAPTFNSVEASGAWATGESNIVIATTVSDPGLGVAQIDLHPEGASEAPAELHDFVGCTGTYYSQCPPSRYHQFAINPAQFQAGETSTKLTARDALGGAGHETSYTFTSRVDRTPPVVDLQGQLATSTKEEGKEEKEQALGTDELRFPVYNLLVKATDVGPNGNPAGNPWERRSGVKNIKIFLRDEELGKEEELKVPWGAQGCSGPAYSCPMEKTYPLELAGREMGDYRLKVLVEDQVGHTTERKLNFTYIPATGMKDEYVMQYFPLPDGSGEEENEEHPSRPELAVNVMSGNLVFRQRDVDVEGPAADLEVERFYNSQLPQSENTEWGDGWTLAQTPSLELEGGGTPTEATMVAESGLVQSEVELPAKVGEEVFDPEVQASVAKVAGGYSLTDETGESPGTVVFDSAGETTELETGDFTGVNYEYEGGELSEIAVEDPGAVHLPSEEVAEVGEAARTPGYSSSFGSTGSGSGQLNHPGDVEVDPAGNLWVADTNNNRIVKYSESGAYVSSFGTKGSGNGQLNEPFSLAIDAAGNVWVCDYANKRVQEFSSSGAFIRKFGSEGTGNGQFKGPGPEGIEIAANGNIWVSDSHAGRIEVFSPSGEFIKVVGSPGTGPGQFGEPQDIARGPGGEMFVADWHLGRVAVFDEAGGFIRQFGSMGTGPGQMTGPYGIAVDAGGTVYVTDRFNNRIDEFNEVGKFIRSFASEGTGPGQFKWGFPIGVAVDSKGNLWVTDSLSDRIQRWAVPATIPAYSSSFGSTGSGSGQLNHPGDVEVDPAGNLWVADTNNNRIVKYSESGAYVSSFGTKGSGNGQLNEPFSLAIDAAGNVWVCDYANKRVQEFSSSGAFIRKFGSEGTGNGQFKGPGPEGIEIAANGNVWVSDSHAGRIEVFSPSGEFIKVVGSPGTGPGQFGEPQDIARGPGGEMFVADWHLGRVAVFDEAGGFIRQFGSMGTGPGQMTGPYGIAVDAGGTVYVTDRFNNRIDMLSDEGEFIARLGAEGTGPGKFKWGFPIGIAVAPKGNLWVTDSLSDRIQHWTIPAEAQEAEAEFALGDDPSVEVEVDGGLVESVEGEEAGVNSYEYEGDLLTAYDGPEGETEYAYNKEFNKDKRLTKVTLPNGTYGEIAYEAKGRVSSVTVSDEGAAPQTTVFEYQDEPTRRTTVKRPKEMPLIYELGEDGSVLKSQSEKAPPGIALSGSLFAAKETPSAIKPGDYELVVEASSPAANITSIQVIANGTALVDEKTCEAPCPEEEDRWVTNTSSWSPGILYLEVLVTDSTSEVTSKRFWVNIPYTPPPAPEAEEPPTFAQIQNFREEFGLDLDVKGNERAINNRIFDLIWAWNHPGTPEGEIARATDERWGSPLRAADAAELDYRRQYIDQAASVIPQWAAAHASSSYAGYYVDHREGGIIHVGFTEGQAGKVSALSQESGFMAPARLAPFPVAPKFPHSQLMATQEAIIAHAAELPGFTRVSINAEGNVVSVGTTASIPAMTTALNSILGSGAPVSVFFDTEPPSANAAPKERIERLAGRVRAGDLIYAMPNQKAACTANFGAWEAATNLAGKRVDRHFLLTAGHCAMSLGTEWIRGYKWQEGELKPVSLGKVSRLGTDDPHQIDGEAIRLEGDANAWAPRGIYLTRTTVQGVTGVVAPVIGMPVCTSGVHTNEVLCGEVVGEPVFVSYTNAPIGTYEIPINVLELPGDSGAPVWQGGTGNAIGLWNSGRNPSYISPLLPVPAPYEENISVLSALQLGPGNVSLAP